MRKIRFIRFLPVGLGAKLFFIPVFVVDAYQGTGEGEDFAEGDEDRVVDLCQWWAEETRREHHAPEGAQCHSGDELEVLFHEIWKLDRFAVRPFISFTARPFALLTEGPLR